MNKVALVSAVAQKTGLSRREAYAGVQAVVDIISDALGRNEKVTITGFGTFELGKRKARAGVNPRTGEKITIPAMTLPRFRAGKKLRQMVK